MKKLTEDIKRILNALAHANAGEHLTPRQKRHALGHATRPAGQPVASAKTVARPQVGLYLGSALSADLMQYVVQTCLRIRHDLIVLTFQSEDAARALLAPYRAMLDDAGIRHDVAALKGEPPADLAHALRRRPEVAFLVCNEAGYFGHGLLNSTRRNGGMPIPVVLVTANDGAVGQVAGQAEMVAHLRSA
ncbi:MAG: hypothetical protein MUC79_06790 [Thiobacillaceae bacterium]|jgi:hypothetical protein|nr:hypothetical protein [Thiobacillaceae bacterium]